MINPNDAKKYTTYELCNLVDIDPITIRKEGERRQSVAMKKIEKLKKQLASAQEELENSQLIIIAIRNELNK